MRKLLLIPLIILLFGGSSPAQTWVDTVDQFARTVYLPPSQFFWRWQDAPLLHAMEYQYDRMPEAERDIYFQYVKRSMDRNIIFANGTSPNAVASATGMAFTYRVTGDPQYLGISEDVFIDYLNTRRTSNGGVSHLIWAPELWDDTVYMIGVFFLSMYRATGDISYLDELIEQYEAHYEKLVDQEWGLWVHGWDDDDVFDFDFCSQPGWADPVTRRSSELWGRGNGWIVVTLSELLHTLPEEHPDREMVGNRLLEMIEHLPDLQDEATGHWYQLPVRAGEEGNFLESSSTAMFGYGILTALEYGLVEGTEWEAIARKIYYGLRHYSLWPIEIAGRTWYTTTNVCGGTCIGDAQYYFDRPVVNGEAYALAMFILFGRAYEAYFFEKFPTPVIESEGLDGSLSIQPNFLYSGDAVNLSISLHSPGSLQFTVIDAAGRTLHRSDGSFPAGPSRMQLKVPGLSPGMYFLTARSGSSTSMTVERFMVH